MNYEAFVTKLVGTSAPVAGNQGLSPPKTRKGIGISLRRPSRSVQRSTSPPDWTQAWNPPTKFATLPTPMSTKVLPARAERPPDPQ